MVNLTKEQRQALKRVYGRIVSDALSNAHFAGSAGKAVAINIPSYVEFRRSIVPHFCGDCVMVPFAGMWLGIERDGYTHS